jgi:hypothetical protein
MLKILENRVNCNYCPLYQKINKPPLFAPLYHRLTTFSPGPTCQPHLPCLNSMVHITKCNTIIQREREEDINTHKMIKQWTANYRKNSKATPSRGLRCQTLSLPNLATSLLSLGFHLGNIKVGKTEPLSAIPSRWEMAINVLPPCSIKKMCCLLSRCLAMLSPGLVTPYCSCCVHTDNETSPSIVHHGPHTGRRALASCLT